VVGIVAVDDIEIVEVAPSGAHDQNTTRHVRPFRKV
jgi:hypothetical protein